MMQGEGDYPLTLKVSACANGETFEYRLMAEAVQVGPSVFRTPLVGDSLSVHATQALKTILA